MKKKALKFLVLALCAGILASTLSACGNGNSNSVDKDEYDRILEENRQLREQLIESSESDEPTETAPVKAEPQRWEYTAITWHWGYAEQFNAELVEGKELIAAVAGLGEEGWELVLAEQTLLWFKRPLLTQE